MSLLDLLPPGLRYAPESDVEGNVIGYVTLLATRLKLTEEALEFERDLNRKLINKASRKSSDYI